jgi:hypothetical protein
MCHGLPMTKQVAFAQQYGWKAPNMALAVPPIIMSNGWVIEPCLDPSMVQLALNSCLVDSPLLLLLPLPYVHCLAMFKEGIV